MSSQRSDRGVYTYVDGWRNIYLTADESRSVTAVCIPLVVAIMRMISSQTSTCSTIRVVDNYTY